MSPAAKQHVSLTIRSSPAHLRVVRGAMEKVCELAGLDEREAGSVVLAVDEALTNIIRHVYEGAEDRRIDVEVRVSGEAEAEHLEIHLRDYGEYVDPREIRSRDLADVRPGGLGVHIMRECMDSVEYKPAEGGGTLLVLRKRLSPPGSGDRA